jgi:hypothetical protein
MDYICGVGKTHVPNCLLPNNLEFSLAAQPQPPCRGEGRAESRAPEGFSDLAGRAWTRLAARTLSLGILALACGCVPLKFTISPGATGRIIDARTHSPVSGAEVVISRSTYPPESPEKAFGNSRSPTVLSNQGGAFSLPVERRLDLYCVPVDVFPRFGLLVVKREGYVTTCVPFWSHSVADLGEIPVNATSR